MLRKQGFSCSNFWKFHRIKWGRVKPLPAVEKLSDLVRLKERVVGMAMSLSRNACLAIRGFEFHFQNPHWKKLGIVVCTLWAERLQGEKDAETSWPVSLVSYLVSSRSLEGPDSNQAKPNKRNKSRRHLRDDTQGCLLLASMCTRMYLHAQMLSP